MRDVMHACRRVMRFRKRKHDVFRLRRNIMENAARFDYYPYPLTPVPRFLPPGYMLSPKITGASLKKR
ncbi:MAG: hypothetical protein IJT27_01445, partial [Clostridia bacterium]|nr:hypothetical protein [Clostridia bacterium]